MISCEYLLTVSDEIVKSDKRAASCYSSVNIPIYFSLGFNLFYSIDLKQLAIVSNYLSVDSTVLSLILSISVGKHPVHNENKLEK